MQAPPLEAETTMTLRITTKQVHLAQVKAT